jgi:hypothetical protein
MFVPEPVISLSIRPEGNESPNFSRALNRFQKEDPTFRVHVDSESQEVRSAHPLHMRAGHACLLIIPTDLTRTATDLELTERPSSLAWANSTSKSTSSA